MIAIYLSPIYIILCIYILIRLLSWLKACHSFAGKKAVQIFIIAVYAFLALSLLTAFLLPPSELQRVMKWISNYWLGMLLYILLIVGIADLTRLVLKRLTFSHKEKLFSQKGHAAVGALCIAAILTISAVGVWQAGAVQTTEYEVTVAKDVKNLDSIKIVMAADLHLGYSVGSRQMEKMVEKINAEKPDLVVFAGDIFDNEYEALDNPKRLAEILSSIDSKYGVYACYGNHDIQEKILAGFTFSKDGKKVSDLRMDTFLEAANIHLLRDEAVLIADSFYLYGRPDYERPGRGIDKRKTPSQLTENLDKKRPIFVIDHAPKELSQLAQASVDLDLCGHTHDGQVFPGNILTSFLWENSYGYLKKGDMHNIVTSGVGVFGPNMRLGTKSEICAIDVTFN